MFVRTTLYRREDEFYPGPHVEGYAWEEVNRAEDGKQGGGIGAMFRTDGSISKWEGLNPHSERLWMVYNTGRTKLAFCAIYLAVKPYRGIQATEINEEILNSVSEEMVHLQTQGYTVSLCGDFNSWLGNSGEFGIPGNRDHINENGLL